jgi:hypothetical protein
MLRNSPSSCIATKVILVSASVVYASEFVSLVYEINAAL